MQPRISLKLSPVTAELNANPNQESSKKKIHESIKIADLNNRTAKDRIQKAYETNFNKWRDYDLLTALIAVIGLALAIVDYEFTWTQSIDQVNAQNAVSPPPQPYTSEDFALAQAQMRVQLADVNFVRVVILIISFLGVFTLLLRHLSKARWLNEDLPNEMT